MAANTAPIFVLTPKAWALQTSGTAVTATTGTDSNIQVLGTAGANGSRIENVYINPMATIASAMVVRFWLNDGTNPGTSADNTLIHEETISTTTVGNSAAATAIIWNAQLTIPAGWKLKVACTIAAQSMSISAVGGDY